MISQKFLKTNSRGLTLIEVLISIILLAIVLAGGLRFYFNSSEISGLVTHKKMALALANARMEDIKRDGYNALPVSAPSPGVIIENVDVVIGDLPANVAEGLGQKVTVEDVDDPAGGVAAVDYKKITVDLRWKEAQASSARHIQLITFMAP